MRKIYLTVGLIASGKSTWAKQFVKENKNVQRVSRDDLRFMTTDYQFTPENEKIVDKLYRSLIETYLLHTDKDIILDEQNLNVDRKESFKQWVLSINSNIEFIEKEFPITLAEALERDAKREFPIGKEVIKNTFRKYEVELKQMIQRSKPKNPDNENLDLPLCILCDIDGSLSDSTNRKIFDDSKVGEDKVIEPVKKILYSFACDINDQVDKIFIMSGRQDSCREQTEKWLIDNNIPFNNLYMRSAGDNRDDTIVKQELYDKYIRGKYRVLFVIDDRIKVLDMWQRNGIFTLDVRQDAYAKNNF